MVRLKEVTHEANPNVVFDLEFFDPDNTNADYGGYQIYRSRRVPDLYGHPAVPVPALTLQMQSGQPLLQFTQIRVFIPVQVSTNLVNWRDLGAAEADDANGEFSSSMKEAGLRRATTVSLHNRRPYQAIRCFPFCNFAFESKSLDTRLAVWLARSTATAVAWP